jgi:hypothetical protein
LTGFGCCDTLTNKGRLYLAGRSLLKLILCQEERRTLRFWGWRYFLRFFRFLLRLKHSTKSRIISSTSFASAIISVSAIVAPSREATPPPFACDRIVLVKYMRIKHKLGRFPNFVLPHKSQKSKRLTVTIFGVYCVENFTTQLCKSTKVLIFSPLL